MTQTPPQRDDGALQKGVELPTPRFSDKGNGTIKDNLTGLIWLKNANCIGAANQSFDADGTAGDGMVTWQHALDFVAGINAGTKDCGDTSKGGSHRTDWRLPNIRELHSLVDFAFSLPAISNAKGDAGCTPTACAFSDFQASNYWSPTTFAFDSLLAWVVDFGAGDVLSSFKTVGTLVTAVRGGS